MIRSAVSTGKKVVGFGGGIGASGLRQMKFALQAFSAALREKPDVIITTHLNFSPLASLLLRLRGIPYWTVAHGIEAWEIDNVSRVRALSQSNKVLAVSRFTRDKLIESGMVSPEKTTLFPNTVNLERFKTFGNVGHLRERYGLRDSEKVILTIGRLAGEERYKGYDMVLKALPKIRQRVPNVKYLLGGTGPDRERVEKLIADLNLSDSVILAGFIPESELSDHYNLCDLFSMPSKGEGFGIVFLEALASGKPVLAGNKDGSVDAVNGGELGVLVDPDNVDEIADASIQILNKEYPLPILYQPEALRARVAELYGFDCFRGRLESLLQSTEAA